MWRRRSAGYCAIKFRYRNPHLLFHGKRIDVVSIESDHPKGGIVRREAVLHPGAVVILPLLDPETVVLIRNERYVVQETLWELPAGTLEKEENPSVCAARELQEETGYQAGQLKPLLKFFTTPGFCNEEIHTFLATDLAFIGQELDETEKIETTLVKLADAYAMIQAGTICDAKTICSLLFYKNFRGEG